LSELEKGIHALDEQRDGDDSVETTALLMQLARERRGITEALRTRR
jgi:hypothetical protein